ncbi:hypothetical protein QBC40DRAFT_312383 [Triangularia verruculosa]|uniref:RING-type domain-containing protein n=1 Tax=Triangularia verruculosa TaxID=2587418 RepID=A0AAN6XR52_9PEZI|nr:hypothetical protein QBC40DRAFT_312383 [Triangularia verruculosa]
MSVSSASMDFESDNWSDSDDAPYSPTSPPSLPDLPDYESDSDSVATDTTLQVITDVSDEELRSLLDLRARVANVTDEQAEHPDPEESETPPATPRKAEAPLKAPMSNYIPDPKYTFLFHPHRHTHTHTCTICLTTPLSFLPSPLTSSPTNDSTPTLLPCGHIFGQSCLRTWLLSNTTCPVCRSPTLHETCKHPIRLRPIHTDTIWLIPRTVPDGGKIAEFCRPCLQKGRQDVINGLMATLGRLYYDARIKWRKTKRERDRVEMMRLRVRMDEDLRRLAVEETGVGEW